MRLTDSASIWQEVQTCVLEVSLEGRFVKLKPENVEAVLELRVKGQDKILQESALSDDWEFCHVCPGCGGRNAKAHETYELALGC